MAKSKKRKSAKYNFEDKVNKQDLLRVHVATPAYDGKVDQEYASSMLMAGQVCTTNMVEVSQAIMGNGAFIDLARCVLVKRFLEDEKLKNFTHFMFIDADLQFEPRAIAGLVRSGLPVCAGAYRRRQEPEDYPVKWTPMEGSENKLDMNGGWLKCERVPTGFLCIQRHVLEKMTELAFERGDYMKIQEEGDVARLFYTKVDEEKRFEGEDFCWCDDYMKLYHEGVFDEPIWVWCDFDFTHGGYKCNYQHYLVDKVDKQSNKRRLGN